VHVLGPMRVKSDEAERCRGIMEPALGVIDRALDGDAGARGFLEQTSSIYVLDATDASKPRTYGCWNFIHQAMNEVERYELQRPSPDRPLTGHVQLLTSMAHRVARRSPQADRQLVTTCYANAAEYHSTVDDVNARLSWLVEVNREIRETAIARIAATAFDFSNHRLSSSAFSERVVMDSLCAILAANAVASGPEYVRQFVTEWIVPSSRSLPAMAVTSVVSHVAIEGCRKTAPAGTKNMLQDLSIEIVATVLVPSLGTAVTNEDFEDDADTEYLRNRESRIRMAVMVLQAFKGWCHATDLSLPQICHICRRKQVRCNIHWGHSIALVSHVFLFRSL
jgi:hypothetical protein